MSNALKKMKKGKVNPSPPVNLKLLEMLAYERGYNEGLAKGAADQRKMDIESVTNLLNGLERLPGIGMVTANKIRILVDSKLKLDKSVELQPK